MGAFTQFNLSFAALVFTVLQVNWSDGAVELHGKRQMFVPVHLAEV